MDLLSPRLTVILSLIASCNCLADIGSDHGYLVATAVATGVAKRGIAVEINELPFEQTLKTVRQQGLANVIDVRLGDGLKPLSVGEADALCIAGMGGGTIASIVSGGGERLESIQQLVLQPNNDVAQLREYLFNNGFAIVQEELVADGDFIYQVIKAQPGEKPPVYSKLELEYGRLNLYNKSDLLIQIIERDINHWQSVLEQLDKAKTENAVAKRQQLEIWLAELRSI